MSDIPEPMADYAASVHSPGKFSAPYEYCGRLSGVHLNRPLTLFLNLWATNQIYIRPVLVRGEPRRAGDRSFKMRRMIAKFLNDESGATAIEYCLIASGIAIVIVVSVNGIGSGLNEKFTSVNASIK